MTRHEDENEKQEKIETEENLAEDAINVIFSEVVVTFVLWILVIYVLIYSLLGILKKHPGVQKFTMFVKIVDFLVLMIFLTGILVAYYELTKEDRNNLFTLLSQGFKNILNDDYTTIYALFDIALFYAIAYVCYIPLEISKMPPNFRFFISVNIIVAIISTIVFVFNNIVGLHIIDLLYEAIGDLFSTKKTSEEIDEEIEIKKQEKEEVYNVSNNLYTYEEAPYVCNALGGRLATYDEIEQSYQNGAEWCNYGWSKEQMAFFPTQKETWRKLQENGEYKNACGRPGINGGYFANPNIKFGVNCFGIKPKAKQKELDMMEANKNKVYPKSKNQLEIEKKMEFWKEHADKLLSINSYNKDNWSRY